MTKWLLKLWGILRNGREKNKFRLLIMKQEPALAHVTWIAAAAAVAYGDAFSFFKQPCKAST